MKFDVKKRAVLRTAVIAAIAAAVLIVILWAGALVYNNLSFSGDEAFAKRVDAAILLAEKWVETHKVDISEKKNVTIVTMLRECNELKANPLFGGIVKSFLNTPIRHYTACWKRQVDPSWPINQRDLDEAMEKEPIYNKWTLYAIAPDRVKITPQEMHLFDQERWHRWKLIRQLNALIILRKTKGANEELDTLIEHLCKRLSSGLVFDIAVVDIYIQKVAFILRAGQAEQISRRWVERIIANQLPDGGWNDRWFCFTSGRRPAFGFATPPSNQHTTLQALTALYLVRYQYPKHFGLK